MSDGERASKRQSPRRGRKLQKASSLRDMNSSRKKAGSDELPTTPQLQHTASHSNLTGTAPEFRTQELPGSPSRRKHLRSMRLSRKGSLKAGMLEKLKSLSPAKAKRRSIVENLPSIAPERSEEEVEPAVGSPEPPRRNSSLMSTDDSEDPTRKLHGSMESSSEAGWETFDRSSSGTRIYMPNSPRQIPDNSRSARVNSALAKKKSRSRLHGDFGGEWAEVSSSSAPADSSSLHRIARDILTSSSSSPNKASPDDNDAQDEVERLKAKLAELQLVDPGTVPMGEADISSHLAALKDISDSEMSHSDSRRSDGRPYVGDPFRDSASSEGGKSRQRSSSLHRLKQSVHDLQLPATLFSTAGSGSGSPSTDLAMSPSPVRKASEESESTDTSDRSRRRKKGSQRVKDLKNLRGLLDQNARNQVKKLLVNDSRLVLVAASYHIAKEQQMNSLSMNLVVLFECNHCSIRLMRWGLRNEVITTLHATDLFREDSIASKLMGSYAQIVAVDWLKKLLKPVIKKVEAQGGPGFTEAKMLKVTESLVSAIVKNMNACPFQLRVLCYYIKKEVEKRFVDRASQAIGAFIFLRFICPALVSPERFRVLEKDPSVTLRKDMVKVARSLQQLVNTVNTGDMPQNASEGVNQFINGNLLRIKQYLDNIATRTLPSENVKEVIPSVGLSSDAAETAMENLWDFLRDSVSDLERTFNEDGFMF